MNEWGIETKGILIEMQNSDNSWWKGYKDEEKWVNQSMN